MRDKVLAIFSLVLSLVSASSWAQDPPDCGDIPDAIITDGVGFSRPESVQWDVKTGFWYVSNQGSPTNPTDGFISRLHPDGTVDKIAWATGLGHPLGIRIFEGNLYVADRDHGAVLNNAIAVYDLSSDDGDLVKTYSIGSNLTNGGGVNDPVVDKKTDAIYVSIFSLDAALGNTVLKVPLSGDGSDATQLASPASLAFGHQPNGTLMDKHDLIVGNSDGEFIRVDLGTGEIEILGNTSFITANGVFDGIERVGGEYLFTKNGLPNTPFDSFLAKIRFQPNGTVKEQKLCTMIPGEGAADIGINRDAGVVAIPHLFQHRITFLNLGEFFE